MSALLILPSIGLTHGWPPLPWGVELESTGAVLTAVVGLALYHPWLKAQVRRRVNGTDVHLAAMILMTVALLLTGTAISRPLAYLLV